jgi:hypothetical protein
MEMGKFRFGEWLHGVSVVVVAMLIFVVMLLLTVPAQCRAGALPGDYKFYVLGMDYDYLKQADPWQVALGAGAAFAAHYGGHVAYGWIRGMSMRLEGLSEIYSRNETAADVRWFNRAGFITQGLIGLALTSFEKSRQWDFTKGYVALSLVETVSYPVRFIGSQDGDLHNIGNSGGSEHWEHAAFSALSLHNFMRTPFRKP